MKNINFLWLLIMVVVLQSCTTQHHVSYLKQDTYYSTKINNEPYIIIVDSLIENKKSKINKVLSTAYLIDNSEFTKSKPFQIEYKRRNIESYLGNRKVQISNVFTDYEHPIITAFPFRFLDSLYAIQIHKDVSFAQAEGYWESKSIPNSHIGKFLLSNNVITTPQKNLDLQMDIYVPQDANHTTHPLLLLIHGGAFYSGDKAQKEYIALCSHFASIGYTTASINYRLGFMPSKNSIERAGYKAVQDAHAALRFLLANADKYKIDSSYIFAGGSSAGGITSLNLVFMNNENRPESTRKSLSYKDLGGIESIGKHNDITFQIKSIANLWGAVPNLEILKSNKVSVLSYHGTKDPIVPYGHDYPMQQMVKRLAPVLFNKMYGSHPIHSELKNMGYREKLVPIINNDTHSLWLTDGELNDIFYQILDDMTLFFYDDLVPNPAIIEQDAELLQRYFILNDDMDVVTWQCNGGFILQTNGNEVFVIWQEDVADRKLIASGSYKNGAAFREEIVR